MLKVLLFEDDPELIDRLAFVLESIKDIQVFKAIDRHQAMSIAKEHRDLQLVVIDSRAGLTSLYELQKLTAHIECILCIESLKNAPATSDWNIIATIERVHAARLLHLHVEHWSREKAAELGEDSPKDYVRIKTKLLIDISPLLSDIYVRLSERKYLKLFQEGDVFDANDLARYAELKKIEYMYLRTDKCQEFIHKYILFIEKHLRDNNKVMSIEDISLMHGAIHESVQELTDKLGFTRDVQSLAKSQVQLTIKTMGKKPSLKSIMRHLENRRGQYSTDHCFVVGYIACAIASHLEWGSEMTFHKLTLASFMHDIALSDDKIIDCDTIEEAKARGATPESIENFKKHPTKVAEMVRQMSEIPPDVDSIVAQHHELPDGTGFPRGISSRYISPLAMIFIVAHSLTKDLIHQPDHFNLHASLEKLNQRFTQTPFKKVTTAAAALSF